MIQGVGTGVNDSDIWRLDRKRSASAKSDDEIIRDLKIFASEFPIEERRATSYRKWATEHGRTSLSVVSRMYGGFDAACNVAGISHSGLKSAWTVEELLISLEAIWIWKGQVPAADDVARYAKAHPEETVPSKHSFLRKFGSWRNLVTNFSRYKQGFLTKDEFLKAVQVEPQKRQVRSIPSAVRYQVLARDRGRCVLCGASSDAGAALHVDHVMPKSRGGSDHPSNLQTLCQDCNAGKSNRDETDFTSPNSCGQFLEGEQGNCATCGVNQAGHR